MKKLLTLAIIAAASAAFAQDVPASVAAPDVPAPVAAPASAFLLEKYEDGGLCKTYSIGDPLNSDELESNLAKAVPTDQGYDTSAQFNGKTISKHDYNAVSWEGFLKSPEAGQFTFIITPANYSGCSAAYVVKINGREVKGNATTTISIDVKKGLNPVYIATTVCNGALGLEYRLSASTSPAVPFTPKNIKHIVSENKQVVFE